MLYVSVCLNTSIGNPLAKPIIISAIVLRHSRVTLTAPASFVIPCVSHLSVAPFSRIPWIRLIPIWSKGAYPAYIPRPCFILLLFSQNVNCFQFILFFRFPLTWTHVWVYFSNDIISESASNIPQVIRCIYEFCHPCISKVTGRRAKQTERLGLRGTYFFYIK